MLKNDPSTGLPWGDHGTANEVIEWCIDHSGPYEEEYNLFHLIISWRDGDATKIAKSYPDYYEWLRKRRGV